MSTLIRMTRNAEQPLDTLLAQTIRSTAIRVRKFNKKAKRILVKYNITERSLKEKIDPLNPPVINRDAIQALTNEVARIMIPLSVIAGIYTLEHQGKDNNAERKFHSLIPFYRTMSPSLQNFINLSPFAQKCELLFKAPNLDGSTPFPGAGLMKWIYQYDKNDLTNPNHSIFTINPQLGFTQPEGTVFDHYLSLAVNSYFSSLLETDKVKQRKEITATTIADALLPKFQQITEENQIVSMLDIAGQDGSLSIAVANKLIERIGETGKETIQKHFRALVMDIDSTMAPKMLERNLAENEYLHDCIIGQFGQKEGNIFLRKLPIKNIGATAVFFNETGKLAFDAIGSNGINDYKECKRLSDEENALQIQKTTKSKLRRSFNNWLHNPESPIPPALLSEKDPLDMISAERMDMHLKNIKSVLKPDGVFVTAIFGLERLQREAIKATELIKGESKNLYKQLCNRIYEFKELSSFGMKEIGASWMTRSETKEKFMELLTKAGFSSKYIEDPFEGALHIIKAS